MLFSYGENGYGFGINNDGVLFLTQLNVNNVAVPTSVADTCRHHLAATKNTTNVVFYVDGVAYPAAPYSATLLIRHERG